MVLFYYMDSNGTVTQCTTTVAVANDQFPAPRHPHNNLDQEPLHAPLTVRTIAH